MESEGWNIFDRLLKVFENDALERVAIVVLWMNSIYPPDITHIWSVPMIGDMGTFGLVEFFRDCSAHDVKWDEA